MYVVRAEGTFAAAHYLASYHGKCETLHGHNYRVRAYAAGRKLDEGGMVLDFGILKKALREVLARLDHTNLNDHPFFQDNPSAERIATYVYEEMGRNCPGHDMEGKGVRECWEPRRLPNSSGIRPMPMFRLDELQ